METIKNMVLWPMSWNFCHHMDLSSAGKTASSLWRRSTAFAKILLLWPTTSSFTWASAMRQRFWRPLHEAVFQDKTHFYVVFNVDCRLILWKIQNWHRIDIHWHASAIEAYIHACYNWYWLKLYFFTAPLPVLFLYPVNQSLTAGWYISCTYTMHTITKNQYYYEHNTYTVHTSYVYDTHIARTAYVKTCQSM